MEDNRINELMESTVSRIRQLVDTNTIIGTKSSVAAIEEVYA